MIVKRSNEEIDLENIFDEFDRSNVNMKALLDKIFFTNGRLFHYERLLCSWFPKYLEYFFEMHDQIMNRPDDYIPTTWKYYLAIMAVSVYECEFLLKILEEQFVLYGGDVCWLS